MTTVRIPRSTKAAAALCERFADLEAQIASVETARNAQLATINAEADEHAAPFLKEREAIRAKLEPWWNQASQELTSGKRKSIELGGCEIGSRTKAETLALATDDKAAVTALQQHRWAKPLLRTTVSIDKRAVLKSIDGAYAQVLAEIGFSKVPAEETFFVKAVIQGGTLAGAER